MDRDSFIAKLRVYYPAACDAFLKSLIQTLINKRHTFCMSKAIPFARQSLCLLHGKTYAFCEAKPMPFVSQKVGVLMLVRV
ncbi:MAG: hypothetical protein CDV28_10388 [Candidatus Electronema aureum]|uniref:Uncharacterized protein n=1 Tax=Candidatus Electronema aureum TaxID=2005002 RepID=A0A521G499_9BACT|nr:MAG: hypothetical protein CDV28_10388 [Candidatus Electronema aureum]